MHQDAQPVYGVLSTNEPLKVAIQKLQPNGKIDFTNTSGIHGDILMGIPS